MSATVERTEGLVTDNTDNEPIKSPLRPTSLLEFVGQDNLKASLLIALQSARIRNVTLDHVLLYGPRGLGKTTLANIIAHEMGSNMVATIGPALEKVSDLVGILTSLQPGDVLFIDEIHRVPVELEEILYPAMEDCRVDFIVGSGQDAKAFPVPIEKFTLVGATTRKGMLSAPLLDRFGLDYQLEFYDNKALSKIVKRSAGVLGLTIDDEAADEIARRSRGTPRIANKLLRRVQDYCTVIDRKKIDIEDVFPAMNIIGIDRNGLDTLDRSYLKTLLTIYKGRPAGAAALAASIQEESRTLTDVVEPFLLYLGLIARTPAGRQLTDSGRALAELLVSKD
jgi:holliday junction DNA helicase RuvB